MFFTNLILLRVKEFATDLTEDDHPPTHRSDTPNGPIKSHLSISQAPLSGTNSRYQHERILISLRGLGTKDARTLELHKLMFAKGHQSTKALEFVLWFLFARLDRTQAHERFKNCWPILDRHDAREFRNQAFKWLDELRKDGCFGLGHNICSTLDQPPGLGVLLPTIRRSYLDESIGERTEQLILILSTYVLSQVIVQEMKQVYNLDKLQDTTEEDIKALYELVGASPEHAQDEDVLLQMIDSDTVRRVHSFLRDMELRKRTRQNWSTVSTEMTLKMNVLSRDMAKVEAERRTFTSYQPQLVERISTLSLRELQVLEDRWIQKINAQWQPILGFVESHVGRKDTLRHLLRSGIRHSTSAWSDDTITSGSLTSLQHQGTSETTKEGVSKQHPQHNPTTDLTSTLSSWKRSLQYLENRSAVKSVDDDDPSRQYASSVEKLSETHGKQLLRIQALNKSLGAKLLESSSRLKRLQSYSGDTLSMVPSQAPQASHQDASECSTRISSLVASPFVDMDESRPLGKRVRAAAQATAYILHPTAEARSSLREALGHGLSDILTVPGHIPTNTRSSVLRLVQHDTQPKSDMTKPEAPKGTFRPHQSTDATSVHHGNKPAVVKPDCNPTAKPSLRTVMALSSSMQALAPQTVHRSATIQQPLGLSKKRRQSSESGSERDSFLSSPLKPTLGETFLARAIHQQKQKLSSLPPMDLDEAPSTPSKRARTSFLGSQRHSQHTIFGISKSATAIQDPVREHAALPPSSIPTLDLISARGAPLPNLTVDDLRAPTPKTSKVKSKDFGTSVPIMFLHTPQRKKLFQLEASPVSKPADIFTAITPPSTTDAKPARLISPNSSLSSSIFSRFKTGNSLWSSKSQPQENDTLCPPLRSKVMAETSPFNLSVSPRRPAVLGASMANVGPVRPLMTTSDVKYSLTRSSVVHERTSSKEIHPIHASAAGDAWIMSDGMSSSKGGVNLKLKDFTPNKGGAMLARTSRVTLKTSAPTVSSETKLHRNPWGCPPSWKPESPRMIDMDKKLHLNHTQRLSAKAIGSLPILESLSQSSMGSLKVSVYGRPNISAPSSSSVSSSSISSSSLSAISNTSVMADGAENALKDQGEGDGVEDDDTCGFSPPPVSPIRENRSDALIPSSSSFMVRGARRNSFSKSLLKVPAQSDCSQLSMESTSTGITAIHLNKRDIANLSVQQEGEYYQKQHMEDSAKKHILDQPIPEDENLNRGYSDDETVLNYALQPIFNNIHTVVDGNKHLAPGQAEIIQLDTSPLLVHEDGHRLFDEGMPDTLDPNEALWENTDVFS
ncbi:hypothetical protein EDD11_006456 [Mortierella claussenii]|nr:hypothetical protein EDD11_006456 [Mortierella claussenii]